jgi:hypothetical protein
MIRLTAVALAYSMYILSLRALVQNLHSPDLLSFPSFDKFIFFLRLQGGEYRTGTDYRPDHRPVRFGRRDAGGGSVK